ncbi:hypothetical protein ACFQV2_16635 [Actinokineospora soli]|uniref:GNAT family N-acetyltransferase n=1 Tax=Actinokineospora soli TaxID=1048753 RepID=A0ABW2TNE4_9PSEU
MSQELLSVPVPRPAADDLVGTVDVIGGRAETWVDPAPPDDDGYEPFIVRGRE